MNKKNSVWCLQTAHQKMLDINTVEAALKCEDPFNMGFCFIFEHHPHIFHLFILLTGTLQALQEDNIV